MQVTSFYRLLTDTYGTWTRVAGMGDGHSNEEAKLLSAYIRYSNTLLSIKVN